MINLQQLPNFELLVDDNEQDFYQIYKTSLVKTPATDRLWAVFSKQNKETSFDVSKNLMVFKSEGSDKIFERLVSGVWFMPDTKYYRNVDGYEFTVSMTKDELKKALKNHLKMSAQNYHNIEHLEQLSVWGMVGIEHWIIEDENTKSPVMGYSLSDLGYDFKDIPVGTVMKTLYISDGELFDSMIKPDVNGDAQLQGFSIEGFFDVKQVVAKMKKNEQKSKQMKELFSKIGLAQEFGIIITNEGKKLSINSEEVKIDDKKVENGEFKTSQNFSVVVRDGKVVDFGFDNQSETSKDTSETSKDTSETSKDTSETSKDTSETSKDTSETSKDTSKDTSETSKETSKDTSETSKDVKTDDVVEEKPVVETVAKSEFETLKAETESLKAELARIKAEKEESLKETPITPKISATDKPADFSTDKYTTKTVGGKTFYFPKSKLN